MESLYEHPLEGVLKVKVLGSDGCDGAAGYSMMSKPTESDHSLAYGIGITEVSTKVQNEKIVLYDTG